MKKFLAILMLLPLLMGCSAKETFETVDDGMEKPAIAVQKSLTVNLPPDAASPVINQEDGSKLYLCDDFEVCVLTLSAGDLSRTVRQLCGYDSDFVSVMQTRQGALKRYEWAWTSAGESSDQVGRAVVLDDGSYHYCVCVMAPASNVGDLEILWADMLASVALV